MGYTDWCGVLAGGGRRDRTRRRTHRATMPLRACQL